MHRLVVVVAIGTVAFSASMSLAASWPSGPGSHYVQYLSRPVQTADAKTDELCEAFRRNSDGSWTSIKPITIETTGPSSSMRMQIAPGQTFSNVGGAAKVVIAGIGDLPERLEKNCRN